DLILKAPVTVFIKPREIVKDSNFRQELRVEITANSLESAIIQNSIKEKDLEKNLVDAYEKLKGKKVIEYYTDGALESDSRKIDAGRMGIGWVIKEKDEVDRKISF